MRAVFPHIRPVAAIIMSGDAYMAEIKVRDQVWRDFVSVAKKKQKKPEALAERLLRDFLERTADEDLLRRSLQTARRSPYSISQIEAAVKARRQSGK